MTDKAGLVTSLAVSVMVIAALHARLALQLLGSAVAVLAARCSICNSLGPQEPRDETTRSRDQV
jgi:hypothetical protein